MSGKKFFLSSEFWVMFLYTTLEMLQQQTNIFTSEEGTKLISWEVALVAFAYIIGRSLIKVADAFCKKDGDVVVADTVDAEKEVIEVAKEAPIIKAEAKEPTVIVEDPKEEDEDSKDEEK